MYIDRKDAAMKLAHALNKYKDRNVVVLAIPRGGVEIGYHVALHLNAEFSLIITRKLGYPDNPEAAFGSVAEDGSLYLAKELSGTVPKEQMDHIIALERMEIQRRIATLRRGKPLPELKDKTVIIVDDGIATGATLFTAIALCRKQRPLRLVVGAPIGSQLIEDELRKMVDEVLILEKPDLFYAVGQGYQHFENLSDRQTIAFLDAWENRLKKAS